MTTNLIMVWPCTEPLPGQYWKEIDQGPKHKDNKEDHGYLLSKTKEDDLFNRPQYPENENQNKQGLAEAG